MDRYRWTRRWDRYSVFDGFVFLRAWGSWFNLVILGNESSFTQNVKIWKIVTILYKLRTGFVNELDIPLTSWQRRSLFRAGRTVAIDLINYINNCPFHLILLKNIDESTFENIRNNIILLTNSLLTADFLIIDSGLWYMYGLAGTLVSS